ncbi:tRNA (adenosine(37)-N6)-threonylcarbamoyltransferase complex ATPase subunit type 1 TsaE [Desulfuribacillus alkaliarsenatis]|uniref:tRNA threonylcarbamoyladenosine biosynthesis protein TsaE n=1 Tax=Desulfuribacillus alkaliarsenatis TaxID=766136 RepID=A0A1E5G240_9FIRM|nr:tRNA (adenosine(37)-N6)-threonylcarbamoyltransferase complex ATPase subunit type 1 TsaE [Desulfuribacillus alkaliarsenatis]OEF96963.1 tRNA (adenosine(37)-N6)-threonylcarbamoyltransferase complex ATPase subunit type 1 TsaE [Desulfuribacillus alkaliarsenatis]
MQTYKFISNNIESTLLIGSDLGQLLQRGDVITLTGDLGAGKTTLTKGIAQGLGINAPVSSPTFTIIKEYQQGHIPLYHFDLYRLGESALDEDLGYEEYLYGDGVCVIEWSQFIAELLPEDCLNITINHRGSEESEREIQFSFKSQRWEPIIKELMNKCGI